MQKIIIASHRRSGTHLVIDSILNNLKIKINVDCPYLTLDNINSDATIKEIDDTFNNIVVFKTHSHGYYNDFFNFLNNNVKDKILDFIRSNKIIYVYRDGRDVLVSLYYYAQTFNKKIKEMPFTDFIKSINCFNNNTYQGDLNRIEYWKYHVSSFLSKSDILLISFEEIIENYQKSLTRISNFTECPLKRRITDIRMSNNENNLIFRLPLIRKNIKTSVAARAGKTKSFETHFNDGDLNYFNKIAGDVNKALALYER